ncbi:unnamed protein product [Closterium sp. NIES-54]
MDDNEADFGGSNFSEANETLVDEERHHATPSWVGHRYDQRSLVHQIPTTETTYEPAAAAVSTATTIPAMAAVAVLAVASAAGTAALYCVVYQLTGPTPPLIGPTGPVPPLVPPPLDALVPPLPPPSPPLPPPPPPPSPPPPLTSIYLFFPTNGKKGCSLL